MDFETWWTMEAESRLQDPLVAVWIPAIKEVARCAWIKGSLSGESDHRRALDNIAAQFDTPEAVSVTAERLLREFETGGNVS